MEVGVNTVALEQVATYGYCSLQHRLRFVYGLPWYLPSYEGAHAAVLRRALREWFRCRMVPGLTKRANEAAFAVLKSGHERIQGSLRTPHTYLMSQWMDFVTGVSVLEQVIDLRRDKMVGFDIPYQVRVEWPGETVVVSGALDVVYRYMAGTQLESLVIMALTAIDDPTQDLVNYAPLQRGFATAAVREGESNKKPVRFFNLPVLRGKSTRWEFKRADAWVLRDFEVLIRNITEGMKHEVAVPTAHPAKCMHCPYKPECRPSLARAAKPTIEGVRESVMKRAESSALWGWE